MTGYKDFADWDAEYVDLLITSEQPEDLHLDYKSGLALLKAKRDKESIGKDASAFANSDGGFLIYGVSEKTVGNKQVPDGVDSVDTADCSRETLSMIIASYVAPRMDGVVSKELSVRGKPVYVVYIPPSAGLGAHQARDKKYYKRFDGRSEPMDHYEVVAVMNRATTPKLFLQGVEGALAVTNWFDHLRVGIAAKIGNRSSVPAVHSIVDMFIANDLNWHVPSPDNWSSGQGQVTIPGFLNPQSMNTLRRKNGPSEFPIYKEAKFRIANFEFKIVDREPSRVIPFAYRITCPGFKVWRRGTITKQGQTFTLMLGEETPD